MGFENRSRPGFVEVASKIALKHGVTYSIKRKVFDGDAREAVKAAAALERWTTAEASRVFRTERG